MNRYCGQLPGLIGPPGLAAEETRERAEHEHEQDELGVQGVAGHVSLI
jgi:hypothetical protein